MPYSIEYKEHDGIWYEAFRNIRDLRKARSKMHRMNCLIEHRIVYVSPDGSTRELIE